MSLNQLGKLNLWEYIKLVDVGQEAVFKGKHPKKFIQVISLSIKEDSQVIYFCTDITKVKE